MNSIIAGLIGAAIAALSVPLYPYFFDPAQPTMDELLFGAPSSGANYVANTLKLPNLLSKGCLGTDGSGLVQEGTCTGGSGGSFPFTATTNYGQVVYATSTPTLWFQSGFFASSTSRLVHATLSAFNSTYGTTTYASSTALTSTSGYFTNLFVGADTIAEYISDTAGAMVTGNTESGITVDYQDADNTLDFTVSAGVANLASADFGDWTCNGSACTVDADAIALGTDTTGNYLATLSSSGSITVGGSGSETAAGTVNLNMGNANTWTALQTFADLITTNSTSTNATTTTLYTSGQTRIGALSSALALAGSTGILSNYAGASCTNQAPTSQSAAGAWTCSSINNAWWSGTDLSVANGGTGLSTFGGTNTILYTTAADTLSSEAAFTYDPSSNLFTADRATFTQATSTNLLVTASSTFSTFTAVSGTTTNATSTNLSVSTTFSLFGSLYSTLASFGNAIVNAVTAVTPTGTWDFGGATSVEMVNGSSPTVDAIGEYALDTTANEFLIATSTTAAAPGVLKVWQPIRFSYASSTQGMGTTTRSLGTAPAAGYLDDIQCDFSNFMRIMIYDGTNRLNDLVASSTIGTVKFTTNNTFTAGEALRVDIGTTTNIASNVYGGCTAKFYYTRN